MTGRKEGVGHTVLDTTLVRGLAEIVGTSGVITETGRLLPERRRRRCKSHSPRTIVGAWKYPEARVRGCPVAGLWRPGVSWWARRG